MTDDGQQAVSEWGPDRFVNRELSWLEFNARVLALAHDPTVPLLEQAKFLAIFSSNADEFFQVRVAGLLEQVESGVTGRTPDGRTPTVQLREIAQRSAELAELADEIFLQSLVPALADRGVRFLKWRELSPDDQDWLRDVFDEQIFPVLTPLAVDPSHPFPYISNLSLNLGVRVRDPLTEEVRFARLKVPQLLPRFLVLPDGERFVPLEQVIAAHLDRLFPGMSIVDSTVFRVTRNTDLMLEEDEADDLLAAVQSEVRRRRFGGAVRLEVDDHAAPEVVDFLIDELGLSLDGVIRRRTPLDLTGLWTVHDLDLPEATYPDFSGITQPRLGAGAEGPPNDFFAVLRAGDLLVQHPYDSFSGSVEEFIRQASRDPDVLAIKLTLYRTSGDSPIVEALIRAAERGKQVAALVELKARFDEENNIVWAKRLEKAGVHVVYGMVGLKTHTKVVLVARQEGGHVRRYSHVGTGNYNPKTARIYEDLGLLTADEVIGADVTSLFNYLTGYARDVTYHRLLVAPHYLRLGLTERIRGEVAAPEGTGHIIMKMNSLVDPDLIDELYAASSAGVRIELIVRGICCLRPGVAGLSENITVRSIVGRYLEHSRVYHFANGDGHGRPAWYFGSADLMPRNLDRRVEAVTPVLDDDLRARLATILAIALADDTLAWELDDRSWRRVRPDGAERGQVDSHQVLEEEALKRASLSVL
ncbi:MAG: polyphosphate kinase 1 [Microthrixaceae bacterium]